MATKKDPHKIIPLKFVNEPLRGLEHKADYKNRRAAICSIANSVVAADSARSKVKSRSNFRGKSMY